MKLKGRFAIKITSISEDQESVYVQPMFISSALKNGKIIFEYPIIVAGVTDVVEFMHETTIEVEETG